jgi:hypothetical protein
VSRPGPTLRLAALLSGGALLLHQARYALAYGDGWHEALASQGHAYLEAVVPILVLVLAAMLAGFARALRRAWLDGRAEPSQPAAFRALWAGASACLLAIYALQESAEGYLEPGHSGGLTGIAAHGGWLALPLALAIGALVAALTRGASAVIQAVAAAGSARSALARRSPRHRLPTAPELSLPAALAGNFAGRAPPATS